MTLDEQIYEWTKDNLGTDFKFRPYQFEAVKNILQSYLSKNVDNFLLEAPTGTGKSFIAFIFAGVLHRYYQKSGYYLVSDLGLLDQCANDIKRFNLDWGIIKGSDNYICNENNQIFNLGVCQLAKKSYKEIAGWECSRYCEYIQARNKAINSPITLMTYSMWLIQRNYVASQIGEMICPFGARDFIICDEAHKLAEIVQNHFSPMISVDDYDKISDIESFARKYELDIDGTNKTKIIVLPSDFNLYYSKILKEDDNNTLFYYIRRLQEYFLKLKQIGLNITEKCSQEKYTTKIPKEWKKALYEVNWINDVCCKLTDFIEIINKTDYKYIVKNVQDKRIVFNCLHEYYLLDKHFHDRGNFKLLMSATLGDPISYAKGISAKKPKYIEIPTQWNYIKSPVYFLDKYRMSYKEKDNNFIHIVKIIEKIFDKHPNEKGIIQCGSFQFAQRLFNEINDTYKDRILLYNNSSEKNIALCDLGVSGNKVLVGPSLIEGISLDDDKCRFQIIMKVPYPSLGDSFVKAKLNYMPFWYTWKTLNSIIQGVGRSVRSADDWAITYIIDGCFSDLLIKHYKEFPKSFLYRIKKINDIEDIL